MDKIKVLLVEDEETLAMIIKDTLEGQSFIIHTAADGEEGLRLFFDLRPDVLVADVMMPRMDGFEMVRCIRQTDKHTPVLFLTARSAINDVVGTLTPRIGNTEAPLREPQSGGQYPECTARPLGRRQLLQLPQPARIYNEAAPQAGARRPHPHRKRAGDRL